MAFIAGKANHEEEEDEDANLDPLSPLFK